MKKHVKIYSEFMGIGEQDKPLCEFCKSKIAVDVNHISPRGMGGSRKKDYIENLIGLCRTCHNAFEAKLITKEELYFITKKRG